LGLIQDLLPTSFAHRLFLIATDLCLSTCGLRLLLRGLVLGVDSVARSAGSQDGCGGTNNEQRDGHDYLSSFWLVVDVDRTGRARATAARASASVAIKAWR